MGTAAENLAESVDNGDRVLLHGHLETETWTDRETGEKRTREVINVEELGLSLTWTSAQRAQPVTNTRPETRPETQWGNGAQSLSDPHPWRWSAI